RTKGGGRRAEEGRMRNALLGLDGNCSHDVLPCCFSAWGGDRSLTTSFVASATASRVRNNDMRRFWKLLTVVIAVIMLFGVGETAAQPKHRAARAAPTYTIRQLKHNR